MRSGFVSLWAFLLATVGPSATAADNYQLLGLYEPHQEGRSYYCRDREMELFPLEDKEEFNQAAKSYQKRRKGEWPNPTLLDPDMAAIVFRFKTFSAGFNCEKQALGVATGLDLEDARKQLADRVANYPKDYRSQPEIIYTWNGGEYKRKVKRNYDGLEITYTVFDNGSGPRLVAQGVNTRTDQAAAFVFISGGHDMKPITLQPGARFNYTLGKVAPEFVEVVIEFREPTKPDSNVIDRIRGAIRDHVSVKGGKIKSTSPATPPGMVTGVRG